MVALQIIAVVGLVAFTVYAVGQWILRYYQIIYKDELLEKRKSKEEAKRAKAEAKKAKAEAKVQKCQEEEPLGDFTVASGLEKVVSWSELKEQYELYRLSLERTGKRYAIRQGTYQYIDSYPVGFTRDDAVALEKRLVGSRRQLAELSERIKQLAEANKTELFDRATWLAESTDAQIRQILQNVLNICAANGALNEGHDVEYSQGDIDRIVAYADEIDEYLTQLKKLVDNLVEYLSRNSARNAALDELIAYNTVFERELGKADGYTILAADVVGDS